ncbi:MAG: hypothetical protein Q8L23_17795 [Caulobacter sp.]|nr:hypothetical protein [Caulobacter sp.]
MVRSVAAGLVGILAAGLVAVCGMALAADEPALTARDIQSFGPHPSRLYDSHAGGPLKEWDKALRSLLPSRGLSGSAKELAGRYGLDAGAMESLITLWIQVQHVSYREDENAPQVKAIRRRFEALLARTGRSRLVLEAAAAGLSQQEECTPDGFRALVGPHADAGEAWVAAAAADCAGWYRAFVEEHPDLATAALVRQGEYGSLHGANQLALYGWLTSDEALTHVAPESRPALAARVNRIYLQLLFRKGLTAEADAVVQRLTPDVRNRLARPEPALQTVVIDGLPLVLDAQGIQGETILLDIVAADLMAGRTALAEAGLSAFADLDAVRSHFACAYASPATDSPRPARREAPRCGEGPVGAAKVMLLDALLHHPGDDPYPLAEVFFVVDFFNDTHGAVWTEVICKLFAEEQYADLCKNARRQTASGILDEGYGGFQGSDAQAAALLQAANLPGQDERKAVFAASLTAAAKRYGGEETRTRPAGVHGRGPLPSRFAQHPVPPALRGPGSTPPEAWLKTLAPLPPGFQPVRVGRDGDRVAIISLSQQFDPTGEVSGGGYWVHLSKDGGKNWDRPLYTGLSQFYPYVVEGTATLPLFDGETLNLAVSVQEIDTDTIMYPPVATRSKRQESDLYLRIPLAELSRDSDGDGLSDIAAEHLLLSPTPAGSTPFVVGARTDTRCGGPQSPMQEAMGAVLTRLFSRPTGAIIEPVDRPHGALGLMGWTTTATNPQRPIFVLGDPADFACLRIDRLMIVYSPADLPALRRRTPDFQPMDLGDLILNRAGDRGYFVYSNGWSGGTIGLRKVEGRWLFKELSSWIS